MYQLISAILLPLLLPVEEARLLSDSITWPTSGPKLELQINGIGNGYTSPVVGNDVFYINGEIDSVGYLFAFDFAGNAIWKKSYGPEWTISYPGARSTPILGPDYLYLCSGTGKIFCLKPENGEELWSVDMVKDLEGQNTTYGYSMKLLIDEDLLFCSPGGATNNVVALNRFTGEMVWSSAAFGETAGYGAPLIVSLPERKVLVTASEFHIFSLDASTGEMLWNYPLSFKGDVPCNTPVYDGEKLYWVAGPGNGAVAVHLSNDGSSFKVAWKNKSFDTSFGGFVRQGRYLIASSMGLRRYVSLDTRSGKIKNKLPFNNGSIATWDQYVIAYSHSGKVGLIRVEDEVLNLVSFFKITEGSKEHFAHPVVYEDHLFIRHGNTLQVFAIYND